MHEIAAGKISAKEKSVSELSAAILKTLLYFDIFHHPLTAEEIFSFLNAYSSSKQDIERDLSKLLRMNFIRTMGSYFFISLNPSLIQRRKKGEMESSLALKKGEKFSKIIAGFPFVRGVFISGSLSKGYMDNNTDIDYFIITEPGRLWLSRTLLVLFKKIFLFNSHKYFCVNYFISTDNLCIPDKNIFTATELVSVIPMFNYLLYQKFREQNAWTENFLPNAAARGEEHCIQVRGIFLKRISEKAFAGRFGTWLDETCFYFTLRYWKRKFNSFDEKEFDQRLRSRKNVSKHHPLGYQRKVLEAFEKKIQSFETKYGVELS